MPDPTLTGDSETLGQVKEALMRVYRVGLLASRLDDDRRRDKHHRLEGLYQLQHLQPIGRVMVSGDDVVQAVVTAVAHLSATALRAEASALFGVDERDRDLDYRQRRGKAVALWDPEFEKEDASFTRRELPTIMKELALVILRNPAVIHSRTKSEEQAVIRIRRREEELNRQWRRIDFKAESWFIGEDQRATHTDWTWRFRALTPDARRAVLSLRADTVVRVTSLSENVLSIQRRYVDRNGRQTWLVTFREPPGQGGTIRWITRRYFGAASDLSGGNWLAAGVRQKWPIERGHFVGHFDMRFPPRRVAGFITDRDTLPRITGSVEDRSLSRAGTASALFQQLAPGKTYGLGWWSETWSEFDPVVDLSP